MSYLTDLKDIVSAGYTWEEAREKLSNTGDRAANIAKNATNAILSITAEDVGATVGGTVGLAAGAVVGGVGFGAVGGFTGAVNGAIYGGIAGTVLPGYGTAAGAAAGATISGVASGAVSAAFGVGFGGVMGGVAGINIGAAVGGATRELTYDSIDDVKEFSSDLASSASKVMEDSLVSGEAFFTGIAAASSSVMSEVNSLASEVYDNLSDNIKEEAGPILEAGVDSAREGVKAVGTIGADALGNAANMLGNLDEEIQVAMMKAKVGATILGIEQGALATAIGVGIIRGGARLSEGKEAIKEGLESVEETAEDILEYIGDLLEGESGLEDAWGNLIDSISDGLDSLTDTTEHTVKKTRTWVKDHTTKAGTKVKGYWRRLTR